MFQAKCLKTARESEKTKQMTKLAFRLKHIWIGSQIIVRRFVITEPHPLFFVTDILVQKTFNNEGKPRKIPGNQDNSFDMS